MGHEEHLRLRTRRGLTVEVRRHPRGLAIRAGGAPEHSWAPCAVGELDHVLRTTVGLDAAEVRDVVGRIKAAGLA